MTVLENKIVALFLRLIELMDIHAKDRSNQSFGTLSPHMNDAIQALKARRYRDPLYYVAVPRWLGEYGTTPIEEEIFSLSYEINKLVVELNGGADVVNRARARHNERLGFPKAE
jgi:hypothetical protein